MILGGCVPHDRGERSEAEHAIGPPSQGSGEVSP
jgi:hypothetical protein